MIADDEIIEVGMFQKTHALKGELNAILDVDEDFLTEGHPLIVTLDGINVPFYAESVRPKGTTTFLIKLIDIDDVDEAEKFVNKKIYALRRDLLGFYDSAEEEFVTDSDLIGFTVVDEEHGVIGEVVELNDTTINTLLVVENLDKEDVYIPFNDEFIISIDNEKQEIIVSLPEELIKLNEKKISK